MTHQGHLGGAYAATSREEVAELYDNWASTYDDEMAKFGYRHPAISAALLARYLPRGSRPVLDAGAGTGLIGEWLGILGYPEVEALDISAGMLARAAAKNCYAKLHQLALGGPLPFANASFAAVISAGVFTTGHVGAEALDELIRITQAGGVLVLTVKDTVWQAGLAARLTALSASKAIEIAEQSAPYISMPGEQNVTPSRAVVARVLARAMK